jgi:multiple sugar transport system substrate-binding protein
VKRWATALSAVVAAGLALTACSGGGGTATSGANPTSGTAAAAPTDLKAEISYAFWDENQRKAIEQNITDFNKTYPNIKVTVNVTPWAQYWTKLQTQAESNSLPDVFWMNGPNVTLYASNGMLAPIKDLVDSGQISTSNYPDSLNQLYTIDGTQYGIPKDFDTVGLWYNKAIFAQAGVELPTSTWTWDDFHNAAKTISAKLKSKGIYGSSTTLGGQESYYNTILQAGGNIISADKKTSGFGSAEAIKGLQLWADMVADGSSPTVQQLSDTDGKVMFASGKSAMCWTGTWAVSQFLGSKYKDDFDVTDLPRDQKQATVIHGLANVVAAKSANMQAAQAFQAYLGSKEAQTTQATMGAANPAFNDTQEAFVKSAPKWNLQMFEDAAKNYAVPYPVSKNTQAWNELETNLLPAAFSGEKPVADVAKDLATQMDAILAAE